MPSPPVDSARIDQINIYHASRLAMLHAVQQLTPAAGYLLIDAMRIDSDLPQKRLFMETRSPLRLPRHPSSRR